MPPVDDVLLNKAGIPQSSRDAFTLLHRLGVIDDALNSSMQSMAGLRNIAVHDYQEPNLDIVISVLDHHLVDFERYIAALLKQAG